MWCQLFIFTSLNELCSKSRPLQIPRNVIFFVNGNYCSRGWILWLQEIAPTGSFESLSKSRKSKCHGALLHTLQKTPWVELHQYESFRIRTSLGYNIKTTLVNWNHVHKTSGKFPKGKKHYPKVLQKTCKRRCWLIIIQNSVSIVLDKSTDVLFTFKKSLESIFIQPWNPDILRL